jgi:two-component system, NtrC family, response regulator AtoC
MDAKKEYSVFLVDDNKMFLETMKNSLEERFGTMLKISEYNTGEECIKHLDSLSDDTLPDIVFLDYYLNTDGHPDAMNGIMVLGKIKAISKEIVVIIVSGQDKLQIATDAIKNGAYDYIAKSESAAVRVQRTIINVTENLKLEKGKNKYFIWNIVMAIIIGSIVLMDIIWYSTSH